MSGVSLVRRTSLCVLVVAPILASSSRAHDGCRLADVNSDGAVNLADYLSIHAMTSTVTDSSARKTSPSS